MAKQKNLWDGSPIRVMAARGAAEKGSAGGAEKGETSFAEKKRKSEYFP